MKNLKGKVEILKGKVEILKEKKVGNQSLRGYWKFKICAQFFLSKLLNFSIVCKLGSCYVVEFKLMEL